MPACHSRNRPMPWPAVFFLLVLVSILSPLPIRAERPESAGDEFEMIWTDKFPKVETRVFWGWPEFLSVRWPAFPPGYGWPESFPPARRALGKMFGDIGWLTRPASPELVTVSAESHLLWAEDSRWSVRPFLLPEASWRKTLGMDSSLVGDWADDPDYEVILVRGGVPPLFGGRGRLRGEYGDEFDDVKRIRGQMLLSLIANHIGIDASVNSWEDKRPAPKSLGDFWTGDANLVYSMDAQRIAMRGGFGASWVYDNDLDLGYNITYGADLFLTRPWLVTGEVDWGKINGDKLFHWRGTFGVQLYFFEVYVGYDSYQWDRIRFDGPVAGAGIWF